MPGKVELIPISEGNRITVKEDEKLIVGRGSSLGCNEKKISRHHAELLLKEDNTLWITPMHTNPVFHRPPNGKTMQLVKDSEYELKDGDQIGLLPSSFYFRVSFSTDMNNNHDSDSDSPVSWKKKDDDASPPDQTSPTHDHRRSFSNQDASVFDFDDDANAELIPTSSKRTSFEKKISADVEPKPRSTPLQPVVALGRVTAPPQPSTASSDDQDELESASTHPKPRKLPKWMLAPSPTSTAKPTTSTPSASYSRNSSYTAPTTTTSKRHLSFEGEASVDLNDASNTSDIPSPATPAETKSPTQVSNKPSGIRSFDSDSDDASSKPTSPLKKAKTGGKRRAVCPFGASCYRKNPMHRAEQSHPGDSDYEDAKANNNNNNNDDADETDTDKPPCPFGKACYRQNPQHKRDFKH